jgi:threonine/homoserine/homoserine lactone efflux protein
VNVDLYIAYLIAASLLIALPGPTVMLVTSISMRRGTRAGLIAVVGSTVAAALQLAVVVAGLASVVALLGSSFELIRWVGVAYLIYLGLSAWLTPAAPNSIQPPSRVIAPGLREGAQGFVVTLTNPKTLLFHGAFLPQFVDPGLPALPQMLVLAITFVAIAGLGDSLWALVAARIGSTFVSSRARRLIDRLSGSLLICAGLALATVRRAE